MFFSKLVKSNPTMGWILDYLAIFHILILVIWIYLTCKEYQKQSTTVKKHNNNPASSNNPTNKKVKKKNKC